MPGEPSPRLTLCLAMDLKRSTTAGLKLSTRRLDRFNLALVNQLNPHLKAVGLEKALIKFTGDGWLVMSDEPEHAAPLCCLAVIMATRFHHEIGREAALDEESIPALRLAICWARDLPVELPDGQRDFVGDSVRHAVRACQLCHDNEILIDETVHRWIHHDFHTDHVDFDTRRNEFPDAKLEERLTLYCLEELKGESAEENDAPEYYVNTLSIIGRGGEAQRLAGRISDRLQNEADEPDADRKELTERFNRLLASNVDFDTALGILRDMNEAGLHPDIATFNALIARTNDYETQCKWLQRMKQAGIMPNIKTYNILMERTTDDSIVRRWLLRMKRENLKPDAIMLNTLISQSKDHATAQQWLERLEEEGVKPNANAYDMLITKAESLWVAKQWVERMFREGIQPALVTFLTLFSKDVTTVSAEELLRWYLSLPVHPPEPMHRAIAAYRRSGRILDALRLCLDYPYTQAAVKVFRAHPEESMAYFQSVTKNDARNANGPYALGHALMALDRKLDAEPWLQRALELAGPGHRRDEIIRLLRTIEK